MAKVVAFSSNKGGVLKTSLAINVAGLLATQGKKTLIIDMDNQGNVATSFGKDPDQYETTIYDLLTDLTEQQLANAIVSISPQLDIIVANDDLAYLEIDILTNTRKYPDCFNLLRQVVGRLADNYDFIIIDTPPAMGLVAANVFNIANDIIIPLQPEQYAFRSLVKTVGAIEKFKATNKSLKIVDVIPTKVRNTTMHRAYIDAARNYTKSLDIPFSNITIRDTVKYGEITARLGMPLTMAEKLSKALYPYKDVFDNLVKELGYLVAGE